MGARQHRRRGSHATVAAARMTDMRAPHAGNATSRTPRAEPIGPAPFLHTLRFFVARRAITANSADGHSLPDTVAIGPLLRDRATPPTTTPSRVIAAAETCDASTSSIVRFDGFGSPAAYVTRGCRGPVRRFDLGRRRTKQEEDNHTVNRAH